MTIQESLHGMLIFLSCGCAVSRDLSHPTGEAVLVAMIQPCENHRHERIRFRAVPKDEIVLPWVRTPLHIDPIQAK
jgi:hypothetical protein